MATAKVTHETVTVKRVVKRIHLTLTEGEADFLQAILFTVSGDPRKSPRKYQKRITSALEAATGEDYRNTDAFPLMRGMGVAFVNYSHD